LFVSASLIACTGEEPTTQEGPLTPSTGGSGGTSGTGGSAGDGMSGSGGTSGTAGDAGMGGTGGSSGGTGMASVSGPTGFGSIDLTTNGKGACTGMKTAQLWTLTNSNGLIAKLTDFGATLVELHVPDRTGTMADIVQGFSDVSGYANSQFAGATVGRVGNRIKDGAFMLDDMPYTVTDGAPMMHSLHGGPCGWDKQVWSANATVNGTGDAEITFTLTSPDMDMGFPGSVMATSVYTLTNANELKIVMTATATAATPINMLHHSYFNLGGVGSGSVYSHELQIFAANYTPAAASGVPEGMVSPVAGTPFDFTTSHAIGMNATMAGVGDQMPPGYDHNWVVDGTAGTLRQVARVKDPTSGRVMTIQADQPGVQFYTTNYRPDPAVTDPPYMATVGKNAVEYKIHEALALETQKHPNAVNFPDSFTGAGAEDEIIRPTMGETYTHTMVHAFTTE
jgi:aldose 1-epimerase